MEPADTEEEEELLRCFFEISEAKIAAELAAFRTRYTELLKQMDEEVENMNSPQTAREEARFIHLEIVAAFAYSQQEGVPIEASLCQAAGAVSQIKEAFQFVASEKGRQKELQDELDAIREREHMDLMETWERGEGPEDYWAALDAYHKISDKVANLFEGQVLRRYGLAHLADLRETNSMRFDVMEEIGFRLLNRELSAEDREMRLRSIIEKYGVDAKRLYQYLARKRGLDKPNRSRG